MKSRGILQNTDRETREVFFFDSEKTRFLRMKHVRQFQQHFPLPPFILLFWFNILYDPTRESAIKTDSRFEFPPFLRPFLIDFGAGIQEKR